MIFLFTKSAKFGSKMIRWGLNEPVSHFAVGFDIDDVGERGLIFHSHLSGVSLAWFNYFHKHNDIVYALVPRWKQSLESEEKYYSAIIDKFYGEPYDKSAFLYFLWRGFLKKFFDKPIPPHNAWGKKDAYLCTELCSGFNLPELPKTSYDMLSPYQIYLRLKQSPDWVAVALREYKK